MSLSNFTCHFPPPEDFSRKLGSSGIKIILNLLCNAYYALYKSRRIDTSKSEDEITEEWYFFILKIWRETNTSFVPIHQKADKSIAKKQGKPPTIDFYFRDDFGDDASLYFGVECKRIESTNKTLCDNYIKNGVSRYVDGKYSQKCSIGSMAGYVLQTDCTDVIEELRLRINKLEGNPDIVKTDTIPFNHHYISKHIRKHGLLSPFTIHHLLLNFINHFRPNSF